MPKILFIVLLLTAVNMVNADINLHKTTLKAKITAPFTTTWQTLGANESITIPINPAFNYLYDVDWGDGTFDTAQTGNATHFYAASGQYQVKITGDFPAICFGCFDSNNQIQFSAENPVLCNPCTTMRLRNNNEKIIRVDRWGNGTWQSMEKAFENCFNLTTTSSTIPDFSALTKMNRMFAGALNAIIETSQWNTAKVTTMESLFSGARKANPDTSRWNTAKVTTMESLFLDASEANPDTSRWNTANVTNMANMFAHTIKANPDTSGWNTAKVTSMKSMFLNSQSANPNTSGWNTANVTNMAGMFADTIKANPDTSRWNTARVTNMASMFADTIKANPDTSRWNTAKVTNMINMFAKASNANPNTSNWNTAKVENMALMFANASKANPNTINWNTANVTTMAEMFLGAKKANPNTSRWNTAKVTDMRKLFAGAINAKPDTSQWNTANVTDMGSMFIDATQANPDTSQWDTGKVTDMTYLFAGAINAAPDTSGWNTANVTDMFSMFLNASKANPDTSNWNTEKVINMGAMFLNAVAANPDTSRWNTAKVSSFRSMFEGAINANPNTSQWNTANVIDIESMFLNAVKADPDTSHWDTAKVRNMRQLFSGASNANPDVRQWQVANVIDMESLFLNASKANPDTTDWNTRKVEKMGSMFANARSANPNTSKWNTQFVEDMSFMFAGASNADPDVSRWDTSRVRSMESMFQNAPKANPNVTEWNTEKVNNARLMFAGATNAHPDIRYWNIRALRNMDKMLDGITLPTAMYNTLLINFAAQVADSVRPNVALSAPRAPSPLLFSAGNSVYCSADAKAARFALINPVENIPYRWVIADGGACEPQTPVAVNDQKNGYFDQDITVLALDNDDDLDGLIVPDSLQIVGTAAPQTDLVVAGEGTWQVSGGRVTFQALNGFKRDPTAIFYTVKDNEGLLSNQARIQVHYLGELVALPFSSARIVPTIQPNSVIAKIGDTAIIRVLTESQSALLANTIALNGQKVNQAVTIEGEGTWRPTAHTIVFTPKDGFNGNPTPINYTVQDNTGQVSNSASIAVAYEQETSLIDNTGVAFIDQNNHLQIPALKTPRGFFAAELSLIENKNNPNEPYWRLDKQQFLGTDAQISKTAFNLTDLTLHFNPLQRRNANNEIINQKNEIFKFYFNDADTSSIYWQQLAINTEKTIKKIKIDQQLIQRCLNNQAGRAFVKENQLFIPEISTNKGQTYRAQLKQVSKSKSLFWRLITVEKIAKKQANCSAVNLDDLTLSFAQLRYQTTPKKAVLLKNIQLKFAFKDNKTGALYFSY